MTKALELANGPTPELLGGAFLEHGGSGVAVGLITREQMPGGHEDVVRHCNDRLLLAASTHHLNEARGQVGGLRSSGGSRPLIAPRRDLCASYRLKDSFRDATAVSG